MKSTTLRMLRTAIFFALVFAAALPIRVSADEGNPPPPTEEPASAETSEPAPAADETPTPNDGALDGPTAEAEETITGDEAAPEYVVLGDETADILDGEAPAEILAALPEGTDLVLLDEQGDPISLTTDHAAEIIAGGDPMWCPVGVTPIASTGGCSISYTSLKALADDVGTGFSPAANGVIWITGYLANGGVPDSSGAGIFFDGSTPGAWTTWSAFSLTFKGGWTEVGTTIASDPSRFDWPISITNWSGDITLSDITINAGGASGTGLTVFTTKNIVLTRVSSNNNTGGANLNNTAGTGTVTINTGNFLLNAGGGLQVDSKHAITLNSVSVDSNGSYGADVDNCIFVVSVCTGSGNLSITNSEFSGNGGVGLVVGSNGNITLNTVTANTNIGGGAQLDNDSGIGTVTITNSFFSSNTTGGGGLQVFSKGGITLSNVTANSNVDGGAWLDNQIGTGSVTISNSFFNSTLTSGGGLKVYSKGAITLTTVTANSNVGTIGFGARLENCILVASACTGTGSVTITSSTFNLNDVIGGTGGLTVSSGGAITLTNVKANSNSDTSGSMFGYGANLDNHLAISAKNVTITATIIAGNEFIGNTRYGLQVLSKGLVSIKDITASENGLSSVGSGSIVNNTYGVLGVTMSGTNVFNQNADHGLKITTNGPVTLNNLIANSNGSLATEYGTWIDNTNGTAQPVTLTGSNLFKFNYDTNLRILSDGLVTLNNITANSSVLGGGAFINNTSGTTAGVTIAGTNSFNDNFLSGLEVYSNGNISVNNVTANVNSPACCLNGVYLNNSSDAIAPYPTVKITGINIFNGNGGDGLFILTNGAITVNSVTANGSIFGAGVTLNNTFSSITTSMQAVTLTGINVFKNNYGDGLKITSYGLITINNMTANANGLSSSNQGADLTNVGAATPQSIKVLGTNVFKGNQDLGLKIVSKGAVTLNSVTASNTVLGTGAFVDNLNSGTAIPQNVSITGTNVFNSNFLKGLEVWSYGTILLNSTTATDNLGLGVQLDNCDYDNGTDLCNAVIPKAITITGINNLSNNGDQGLLIQSIGPVSVNSLTASGNFTGVSIDNCLYDPDDLICAVTSQKVTLSGANVISENNANGLHIESGGAVSINSITASGNGGVGVELDNCRLNGGICTVTGNSFTLSGTNNISLNDSTGLSAYTSGAIAVNNLTANGNGATGSGYGTVLNNKGVASASVKLTGASTFNSSPYGGLQIDTKGAVSLNNVTANNTGWQGATITNTWSGSGSPQNVTFIGINNFNDNDYTGLYIVSFGVITINNVTGNGNGVPSTTSGNGAYLDNCILSAGCTTVTPKNVILTGTNTFSDNTDTGIVISSKGAISSATSLTANNNGLAYGAQLDNEETGAVGGVTLLGINTFNSNATKGLSVTTLGAITINNLTVNENAGIGAYLVNSSALAAMNVTLSGYVKANGNDSTGVDVDSDGVISLANIAADDNGSTGVELTNATEGKGVTISGTNLVTNSAGGAFGVYITSHGPVTINNLTSSNNDQNGLYIHNAFASGAQTVKLTGNNIFEGNLYDGLVIYSTGAITLNNISASNNGTSGTGNGAFLSTTGVGVNGTVTLTGINTFSGNDDMGLSISTSGNVTVSKITADDNGQDGFYVGNPAVNVNVTCGSFTNNTGYGLNFNATGVVTLKGVWASGNGSGNYNLPVGTLVVRTC